MDTPHLPENVSRKNVLEAMRALGFETDNLATAEFDGGSVRLTYLLRDMPGHTKFPRVTFEVPIR